MSARKPISLLVAGATLAVSGAAASPAAADNATCSYVPASMFFPAFVSASLTPSAGASTSLRVKFPAFGSEFFVSGANGGSDCTGTVNNTDVVSITDGSAGGAASLGAHLLQVGVPSGYPAAPGTIYAPGATDEPGSSDEIEMGVGLGPGRDFLTLSAFQGGAATIRLGAQEDNHRINLNAAEQTGIDQDVTVSGVDEIRFSAEFGNFDDDVRGSGGLGTGDAPIPIRLGLNGYSGDDRLVGGSVGDTIIGDNGEDALTGDAGGDRLRGGSDNDLLRGGSGRDDLRGGSGADLMFGSASRDTLGGSLGPDTLQAGKGNDRLDGGTGRDLLVGGAGFDRCFGGLGRDVFVGCEIQAG